MYKKISKKNISLSNIEIKKFHHGKNLILFEDKDTDNMLIFSMISSGEKNINTDDYKMMMMIIKLNHYT